MRRWVAGHCIASAERCIYQTYGRGRHRESNLQGGNKDPHSEVSMRSVFCFQPLGDLHTRKGLFDALLYGCIPVTFDPLTATAMYIWHWSEELWRQVAIQLPYHRYSRENPVEYLRSLLLNNASEVRRRQQLLRANVFRLQYALEDYSPGSSWPLDEAGKPVPDAYSVAMELVLGWQSGRLTRYRNASVPECWDGGVIDGNRCIRSSKEDNRPS